MNRLKTDINGKFPYVLDDIRFLDTAYRMGFEALAKAVSFNRNSILWGCIVTELGGNNISVSAGAVLIDGEIMKFEEAQIDVTTGNKAVITRDESFDPAGNKLFGDGTMHDTYQVIKGKLVLVPEDDTGSFVEVLTSPRISEISDFDGLIYKGLLTNTDNLNNIDKTGLYIIRGNSLPDNFPVETVLGATIEQGANFWLKSMYVGRDNKYYQELGFKKGIIARRYLHEGTLGWSEWYNFWASNQDVIDGTKKCAVISPYSLNVKLKNRPGWVTIPASLAPRWSLGTNGYILYRVLNNGMIQIKAKNLVHDYSQSFTDNNDLIMSLPLELKPIFNIYAVGSVGEQDDITNDASPYVNSTGIKNEVTIKINTSGKLLCLGTNKLNTVVHVHFDLLYFTS